MQYAHVPQQQPKKRFLPGRGRPGRNRIVALAGMVEKRTVAAAIEGLMTVDVAAPDIVQTVVMASLSHKV